MPAPPKLEFRLLRDPVHVLALGFGAGLSRYAPGTVGSLVAVPLVWLLFGLGWPLRFVIVVAAFVAGIWICGISARRIGCHDHPGIVWDEISAMLSLTLVMPRGIGWIALGFALFRFFDIFKPWPIRDLDHRLHGGLGIMLDDVAAAVFAAVLLRLIEYLVTLI
jgi:phosphatidylglycerophosphatase A